MTSFIGLNGSYPLNCSTFIKYIPMCKELMRLRLDNWKRLKHAAFDFLLFYLMPLIVSGGGVDLSGNGDISRIFANLVDGPAALLDHRLSDCSACRSSRHNRISISGLQSRQFPQAPSFHSHSPLSTSPFDEACCCPKGVRFLALAPVQGRLPIR